MRELWFCNVATLEIFVGFDYTIPKVVSLFNREIDGFTLRLRSLVVTVSKRGG